eukprot:EG_transcript_27018
MISGIALFLPMLYLHFATFCPTAPIRLVGDVCGRLPSSPSLLAVLLTMFFLKTVMHLCSNFATVHHPALLPDKWTDNKVIHLCWPLSGPLPPMLLQSFLALSTPPYALKNDIPFSYSGSQQLRLIR